MRFMLFHVRRLLAASFFVLWLPVWSQQPLTLGDAVRLAVERSRQPAASDAALSATSQMAVAAGSAAPMVGGMITAPLLSMGVIPRGVPAVAQAPRGPIDASSCLMETKPCAGINALGVALKELFMTMRKTLVLSRAVAAATAVYGSRLRTSGAASRICLRFSAL